MAGRPGSPRSAPATPRVAPDSSRQPAPRSGRKRPAAAHHTSTARNPRSASIWFPSRAPAMTDRPDRTDFPASETNPKPNFETLPEIGPASFSAGRRVPAAAPQPPASEAAPPEPPARACGGLETKRLRRHRGRQDRPLGDSSAPRLPPPSPHAAAASPHRRSGDQGPAPTARSSCRMNNGRRGCRRPRLRPSATPGLAGCRRTD